MNKFLPKLAVLVFLLIASSTTKAQPYTYKGMYVYAIDSILSDPTGGAENILLRYCRDSAFNAITISPGVLNLHTSPTYTTKLAAFMKKARTRYGVKYIAAVVSDFATLLTEVHTYQMSRTDSLERFNHYNYEFEYWNDAYYKPAKGYCVNFLQPNGYACDSVGAWSYFAKNMKSVDSLAQVDNIKSTVYIGVSSKDTLKNRFVANTVDLVMLACYNADTSKLYMGHTVAKLTSYSKANHKVDVLPIFASLTKSVAENLKQYLTGPAPTGKHSEASVLGIFMREYATLSPTIKSKINMVGYKWFKYGGMPKDSTTTALNLIPTGLAAVPSSTSAALSWSAVAGASSYRVMYAKANTYAFTTVNASDNNFNLTGLLANTSYQFLVYSVASNKTSASSTLASFTTTAPGGECAVPIGLGSSSISDVVATLNWTAVSGAASYAVKYRIVGAATWISTTSSTNSKALSGLTASSNYEFQVQTSCGSSTSAFSASSNFSTTAAPCNSPNGLGSSGVTTNSATVAANAVSNATSYNIQYRAVGASTWTNTTSLTVSKTLSGLNPATSYEFQEQAVCPTNTSQFSTSSNFATASPPCNVPSGLSSSAVTDAAATISWTAVSGATSYAIQYRAVGSSTWIATTSTTVTKNITGLVASTPYEFQVKTVCSASSSSAFSTSSNFTTPAPPCNVPSGLSSASITYNSATISWTAVSGASSYALQYRVSGTAVWISATSTSVSKALTGLSASSTYEFQIQTVCSAGNTSSFSSSATFTTPAPPCNVPTGIGSSSVTSNSAVLNWTAFAGATSYAVQYRIVGASTWISSTCAVTTNTITGLTASANYEFQVKSVCSASNSSAFSSSSTFSTPAPPCNIPTGLSSTAVTHNAVTLSWTAIAGATTYALRYRIVGAASWITSSSSTVSKNLSALTAASNYEFQVQTDCGSGNTSSFTSSATFTTLATPCGLPSALSTSAVTSSSATLNWGAISGAASFAIQYRVVGSGSWTSTTAATNSKAISGLNHTSNYEFQVQSNCGAGNISAFSSSATFATPAPPCNVVSGLAASAITENTAIINWIDFAGASGYNVKYRIVGAATWTNTTSAINSMNLVGLLASSTYEFQIQSNCGAGNTSAFTTSTTFSTLAPPCNVPTGLTPTSVTTNSAILNWNSISGTTGYTIQYRIVGAASWNTLTTASTTYTLSGLNANSTYEFSVQSTCSANASAFASVVSFATSAPPCAVSTGLSSTAITSNSANLSWAAISGASTYNIQYRVSGSSVWTTTTSASNLISLSGLNAASNYEFQIQTECSSGNTSPFSTAANFTTLPPPCNSPVGLSAASVTDNSVSLSWNNIASALSYVVQYRIIGTASWTSTTSALNTKNLSGLSPVSTYEFQVQSDCGSGNTSAFSSSSNFITLAPPCNIPAGLSVSAVTENSALLNWSAISGADGYTIQYRVVGASNWTTVTSIGNSKSLSVLNPSTAYEFQVQTNCSFGAASAFTASSNFTTPAPPCNTPSGLSSSSVTYNSAILNWTSVSGANSYTVKYRVVGAATWISTTSVSNSKTISSLLASSNYEFQIQSDCGNGNTSSLSASADFFTPAPPCNLASGLSSSAVTYNSATLNWSAAAGVSLYTVRYKETASANWISTTSTTNSKAITSLVASTNYEFQVQSDCGAGNTSVFTASAAFATPAPPCNAPSGLSSSAITYNTATLNWTAFSGATNYTIKYRVIGTPTWTSINNTSTSINLSSLTSSSNYEFKVQSTCGAGNISSFTSTSTFLTPAPPCLTPSGLSSSSITSNSAILNWAAVAGVTNYNIQYRVVGSANWTSVASSSTTKTLNGLNPSSNYEFQLQSDCGAGNLSSFSSTSSFSTPLPPCNLPTSLLASSITDEAANLDWTDFSGAIGYAIRYRIVGTSNWISATSVVNTKIISGLTPSSNYEFQVQSDCGNSNTSGFTNSANFSTIAPPCNVPTGLSSASVTNNSAILNWNAIAGATSYNIQYRETGAANWISATSATNTYNLSGINANASFEFQVQSVCSASSNSLYSSSSTFATSAPACLSPNGLTATNLSGDAADVSWSAVSGASTYNVQYRIVGASVWNPISSASNSITLNALIALSSYEYQVQTVCASGNSSPFSSIGNFSTLAPPCITPVGLSANAITDNSVSLSWTDFPGAINYNLEFRISGTSTWNNLTSAINTKNISALQSATVYEYRVQSNCGVGNTSLFSDSLAFTTLQAPCNIPTGLSATSVTHNAVTFDWNAIAGSVNYKLRYRVIGSGTWIDSTSASNSLAITNLSAASNYEFQVQNNCGNATTSNFSASSAFTTLAAPCAIPSGLASSAITFNSASVNWTAVAGAVAYTLEYKVSGALSWTTINCTTNSKSITALNSSSNYEFQVAADCGNGNASVFSSLGSFITAAAPCAVPSGLNAQSNSPNDATLGWTSVAGAVGYEVRFRISGAPTWLPATTITNSAYINNLLHSSNYEYQIQSDCGSGNTSAFSGSANFTTPVPACNIPTGLAATNVTHNSAVLDWTSVSGAANYIVQYRTIGSSTWISATTGSSSSFNLASLLPSTNYEFQVQTSCQSGNSSPFSLPNQFFTDIAPCNIPLGLTASNISDNSADLNWTAFSGAVGYAIQYRVSGTSNWILTTSTNNSVTISSLQAATLYDFQVESTCSANNTSGFGNASSFTTLPLPCSSPAGLNANGVTASTATLAWMPLSNAIGYAIEYRISGASNWASLTSNTASIALTGLSAASTYEFQVQSTCNNGLSPFSSITSFATANPSCSVPVNLNSSGISETVATVSWDAVSGASSYLVEYRVSGTSIWTSVTSTLTTESLNGLLPSSTYEFHVQSICSGSSTSAFSNNTMFTTLSPACLAPSNLGSANATANSVLLNWDAASNAASYNLQYRANGASTWIPVAAVSNSQNLLGLSAGTIYEFQVQTNCGYGLSNFSNSGSFATSANSGAACDSAGGLFASSIKSTSAKLNWNPVNNATSYKVQYKKIDAALWTNKSTSFTNRSVSSLSPNTEYQFKVQTNCGNTAAAYSSVFLFRTAQSLSSAKAASSYSARAMHSALGITLNWTAKNEENVAYYTIERSEDNMEYEPLRNVAAAGNSTYSQDYEFNDIEMKLSPVNGTVWYRLSMTDSKGNITYLRTIEVTKISEFEDVFKVYPNPTTDDNINLTVKLERNEEMLVILMDILGNQIYSKVIVTDDNGFAASGINPGKDLKPGIYEIVGYSSKRQMSKKLIIL